jgi:polyferredoxin
MTWSRWRRVRQVVQILAFALYVYLLFAALQRRAAFSLADLFFRLNPLAALAAMVADRVWIPRLALALVTLVLTLLFGRVWCGWLCPLGTLLEWVRFPARAWTPRPFWRKVKYFVLIVILAMSLFGSLTLLVFDPITLFTRTMTTVILPALNHAVTAVETALYPVAFFRPVISWVERVLRGPVLPVIQPAFSGSAFIFLLFLGVLALDALADRFWCRYLCPLGGLLGLISKVALFRPVVQPACNRCGHCVRACRLDAIDTSTGYDIIASECTVCLDCLAACPEDGIGFRLSRPAPSPGYNPTRRQVLTALGASTVSVALLRTEARFKQPDTYLIRPPGVDDEGEFLSRCVRCSQCMKVCPTSGLQPVVFEAGLEALWTPQLVPRLGHCDHGCNACGQICPSGAIPPLELAVKQEQVLGLAAIDQNRCWPWAYGIPCIVCEEMCPIADKAIELDTGEGQGQGRGHGAGGGGHGGAGLQKPFVIAERCIGCGVCEQHCPVEGEAAIRVYRR